MRSLQVVVALLLFITASADGRDAENSTVIGPACHGDTGYCNATPYKQCVGTECYCCFGAMIGCRSIHPFVGCICSNVQKCPAAACVSPTCNGHGTCPKCADCTTAACTCNLRTPCICHSGWSGIDCSVAPPDPCKGVSCGAHGTCVPQPPGWHCNCRDGWTGIHCETAPPPPDPCKGVTCSGHGKCKQTGTTTYVCVCDPGFVGTECEHVEQHDRSMTLYASLAGGCGGLALLCFCSAAWMRSRRIAAAKANAPNAIATGKSSETTPLTKASAQV